MPETLKQHIKRVLKMLHREQDEAELEHERLLNQAREKFQRTT